MFKGTVSNIKSNPPCKDCTAWFTTVPLKALSDQDELDINVYTFEKLIVFNCGFSAKVILLQEKVLIISI